MRIVLTYVALMVFAVLLSGTAAFAVQTDGVAVVVNDEAISYSDVEDRVKMIVISAGLPNSEEIRSKVLPQVINSLIEEQIKLQEANKLEIAIDPAEVDQAFAMLAQQNNMPVEKFRALFNQSGINPSTMDRQLKAQIAWTKIIQQKIRPQISISDSDVEDTLARLRQNIGKDEYLMAEIFLPVDDPGQEASMKQLADRLVNQMVSGQAPFFKVAQQFSKAAGSSQGGDMGWVQKSQLPEELAAVIDKVNKGEISPPVRSLSGYHILYVRDKRTIEDANIPPAAEVLNSLGLERLDRAQRRYYMDLKSSAFIETRV